MPYAVKQDMIDRFGQSEIVQLTDRAIPPAGVIDDAVLDKALSDGDAKINSYLQGRYALPLAVVPESLERLACDIARFYLYDDRPTETVTKNYDDAIEFLKAVATGTIKLGVDGSNQSAPVVGTPEVSAPDRLFTRETLNDF